MKCRRCGNCCTYVNFTLGGTVLEGEGLEYARYVAAHGCQILRVNLDDEHQNRMGVRIPLVCRHLDYDGETGLCSCDIYETRPAICRNHYCKAARDE